MCWIFKVVNKDIRSTYIINFENVSYCLNVSTADFEQILAGKAELIQIIFYIRLQFLHDVMKSSEMPS